jgi:hypothetical protein
MAYWVVAVSADRYQAERLYQHDVVELAAGAAAVGDDVVLVAPGDGGPVVFGVGRVVSAREPETIADDPDEAADPAEPGAVVVEYLRRFLDRPVPAAEAGCSGYAERAAGQPVELAAAEYSALTGRLPVPAARRRDWMVSLDLPIEAGSPAEAVRVFWTYVRQLGPQELPAFVWPHGDELAMRPYVLGAEHEMDPEEED